MSQPTPDRIDQEQDNQIKDTNVDGNLIYAPVQIGTNIETQIFQSSLEVKQRELNKKSPYQGLKRFNFKDRDHFFGRDKLIAQLFEAVNRSNLSLVLGASGSGKSSVVRAGLIPELKKSLESQTFYDFIFTPNQDPFDSLYRCLLSEEKDYDFSKAEAEIALEAKSNTLIKVISTLKKDEERWLIFVDQFEELFTICNDLDKRENFISGLVEVAKSGNSSVKIVLAMRSDFLEQFSFYPALGAIANQNNFHLVTEMYPDELRQAIEQPAAKHGVVFEEGLVEQIIKEIQGQKGYLPLLQYTLDLLWKSECQMLGTDGRPEIESRELNRKNYAALEGVRGALQKHVNEIYSKLNQDQKTISKQIFLTLVDIVDIDSGHKVVNKRAYRNEFIGDLVEKMIDKFIDENLLVSSSENSNLDELQVNNSDQLKPFATVEIAHEILLSSWDELKRWLEDEKEVIILKSRLVAELRDWKKARSQDESKANEQLLKPYQLAQIVELRSKDAFKNVGGLKPEENEFIDLSMEWQNRLERAEEERRKRELEAAKLATRLAITTAIGTLLALFAGGFSFWQQQQLQFQETIESVFLDINNDTTLNALPSLLKRSEDLRRSIDTVPDTSSSQTLMNYYQQYEDEFTKLVAYYRNILAVAQRVQEKFEYDLHLIKSQLVNNQDSETGKPFTNEQKVKLQQEESKLNKKIQSASEIEKEAATSLTSLSKKYRINSNAEKILEKLKEANIGYSINKNELIGWIDSSDRRYYNISIESLNILQGERLKNDAPGIDVIYYYYQELLGGRELPVNPKIDKGNLKEAIRRAYNNKNGTDVQSFEEIAENARLPKS